MASLKLKASGRKTKELIRVKDLSFSFADKVIFKNINLTIAKGDKIAICGSNGAGKTTLINLLLKALKPDAVD